MQATFHVEVLETDGAVQTGLIIFSSLLAQFKARIKARKDEFLKVAVAELADFLQINPLISKTTSEIVSDDPNVKAVLEDFNGELSARAGKSAVFTIL